MKTYRKYYRKNSLTKRKQSGGGCNSSILDQYVNSNITMLTQYNNHSVRQFTQTSDYAFNHMKNTPVHYLEKIDCRIKMIKAGKNDDAQRKLIVFKKLIQRLSNELIIEVDRLITNIEPDS